MKEKLDVYDENKNRTGKVVFRGTALPEGEKILLTVVWLKNGDKYLVQKTSEAKGGEYAITGGHVPSGKTSKEQALVEVKEELGLDLQESKLQYLGDVSKPNAIFDVYQYELTGKLPKIVLQESEVEDALWLTKGEIEGLIAKGVFRKSSAMHYEKFIKDQKEL